LRNVVVGSIVGNVVVGSIVGNVVVLFHGLLLSLASGLSLFLPITYTIIIVYTVFLSRFLIVITEFFF